MPPARSGIAAYSDELLPRLRATWASTVDVYAEPADRATAAEAGPTARDFVLEARRRPYDLTVYQLGNACLPRLHVGVSLPYPGLVVLHDAQCTRRARRRLLARYEPRRADYLAEFAANHPRRRRIWPCSSPPGWAGASSPTGRHIRLVLQAARLTAVHSRGPRRRSLHTDI